MSETPETDAARMFGYGEFGGDWVLLERNCYEKHPEGDVIFSEVAERLERERDEARRDLVASEELHRRRFEALKVECQSFRDQLTDCERDRDDAWKGWTDAINGWNKDIEKWMAFKEKLIALLKEEA